MVLFVMILSMSQIELFNLLQGIIIDIKFVSICVKYQYSKLYDCVQTNEL